MTLNVNLTPELEAMVRDKVATGLYSSASETVREASRTMEETDRFNRMKLEQLRNGIQAGITSSDAGTLDAGEIKRRGLARLKKAP